MIVHFNCTSLNGQTLPCKAEIFVDGPLEINREMPCPTLLTENSHARTQARITEILQQAYPSLGISSLGYALVSRDLENIQAMMLHPDAAELAEGIYKLIMNEMASTLRVSESGDKQQLASALAGKQDAFSQIFLETAPRASDPHAQRAEELFREKKYAQAKRLLKDIDRSTLSPHDEDSVNLMLFKLVLLDSGCNPEKMTSLFEKALSIYINKPRQAKQYYFSFIRYLEDCRDPSAPRKIIEEFEKKYPLSILDAREKAEYFYLKGRTEYGRGEFLGALKSLQLAMEHSDKSDQKLISAVYTIAANCFSDNFFFEDARAIAGQARELREILNLPERYETQGCLAGIAFKQGDFEAANDLFQEYQSLTEQVELSLDEENRLYNYLAKAAIMLGNTEEAARMLAKASQAGDRLGFSVTLELLLLLRLKAYPKMQELFLSTCLLPEAHRDYDNFALGWSYSLMARSCFEQQDYLDGVKLLARGINFFQADLYVVEAAYVMLYLYNYPLPPEATNLFDEIQPRAAIMENFEHYVGKHQDMAQQYAGSFIETTELQANNLLLDLYERMKSIDENNYNPQEIQDILDSVCLY